MSSSTSTTDSAARKQQRRNRFFEAISTTASPSDAGSPSLEQSKKMAESKKQQKAKEQPPKVQQSAQGKPGASTSKPSKFAPAALSAAEVELLKSMKHEQEKKKATPMGPALGKTLEEQKRAHQALELLWSAPAHTLPAEMLAYRTRCMQLGDPLEKLKSAPMGSLPPELQKLKREQATQRHDIDYDDAYGHTDIKRRMSKLLRENNEPDFPWDDFAVDFADVEKTRELQARMQARFASLQRRKPKVFAEFFQLHMKYMKADEPKQTLDW